MMNYKKVLSYLTASSAVTALQYPAAKVLTDYENIEAPEFLKYWLIVATTTLNLVAIQWFFLLRSWPIGSTNFFPKLPKIMYAISIPTFALLIHANAVLNDSFYLSATASSFNIFKCIAFVTDIAVIAYGLTILLLINAVFNSPFESQFLRKSSAWAFAGGITAMSLYYGVSVLTGDVKVQGETRAWTIFAMLISIIFVCVLIKSTLTADSDCSLLTHIIGWGSAPSFYWAFRGYLLYNRLLQETEGSFPQRYALISLWRLVLWTVTPTIFFTFGGVGIFVLANFGILKNKTIENPLRKQKLHVVLLDESGEDVLDIENPTKNKEDKLRVKMDTLKSNECAICWENFITEQELLVVDGCKHAFHKCCLNQWVQKDSRCPLCRANIE